MQIRCNEIYQKNNKECKQLKLNIQTHQILSYSSSQLGIIYTAVITLFLLLFTYFMAEKADLIKETVMHMLLSHIKLNIKPLPTISEGRIIMKNIISYHFRMDQP